jgi:predicted  nucleic acid-binding Zn-ribbon protein
MSNDRCPSCKSDQIYHRLKTSDARCRKCGNIWKDDTGDVCAKCGGEAFQDHVENVIKNRVRGGHDETYGVPRTRRVCIKCGHQWWTDSKKVKQG